MMKHRLLAANVVGMFVLAYALLFGHGLAAPLVATSGTSLTTQFIYEGRLSRYTGTYDFQFRLFNAASGGALVGSPTSMVVNDTAVTQGEYQAVLDFGAAAFMGEARYLEVGFRNGTSSGSYAI